MKPKEKAQELIDKAIPFVHGYVGSSMLSNYEYPETIQKNAEALAIAWVDEVLWSLNDIDGELNMSDYIDWWVEVKQEIQNYGNNV